MEKIKNVVTNLVQDGIAAPTYWIAVFGSQQAIFLKISKHTVVELASPLANRLSSANEIEEIARSFREMTVDQILSSEYEKAIFPLDKLKDLVIIERPDSFFRSVIKFPFLDKQIKLSTNRENIRSIKSSLYEINSEVFPEIKSLHSENYQRNISYFIKAIGLILFFWNIAGLFDKVGFKEIFLAVAGVLIFFKRKIGAYVLAAAIVIDFVLMKIFATQIEIEDLLKGIIVLVVLGGVLLFLWKYRNQLK